MAAPFMPIFNLKISNGSNNTFNEYPATIKNQIKIKKKKKRKAN
jgi:hypothetical protein